MNREISGGDEGSLRQQTVSGIGWSSAAQIGRQGLMFLITVLLARLLTPEDFGLVGMILVFTGFVALFGELGFGAALIQRNEVNEKHFSSIFWVNLGMGAVLTVLLFIAAPLIAAFFREPSLTSLMKVGSFNFLIVSLGLVQKAILERNMQFRLMAFVEITAVLLGGSIAVVLALTGYGVWSLIWQLLLTSIITVVALWLVSKWRPQLIFNRRAISDLWGFSSHLLGFNAFNYWARNADNLLIGRFIGPAGLGIYTRAYTTMLLPLSQVTNVFGRVMFPALSKVQHDKERVKFIYLRAIAVIALVTFPMMLGLFVVADHFVLALYGPNWSEVIPVLRILCMVGLMQSIASTVGWIYQSQGRTDWLFRWGVFASSVGIVSFVIGIYIGTVEAVAFCYAVAILFLLYWNMSIPGKLIDMRFREVVRALAAIFACAMGMALIVWAVGMYLPSAWPQWLQLLIQSVTGCIIYWGFIHIFRVQAYSEAKFLLLEQWQIQRAVITSRT